jgi:hypothetical protein
MDGITTRLQPHDRFIGNAKRSRFFKALLSRVRA